jgi:uncharacterized protein YbjT (DUF2867 family)
MQTSPILLIGGTRGTGLLITRLLMERGFPVRVMARNPERAAKDIPHPAEIVLGDITIPSSLPAAINGARHIIFTAGCRSGRPAGPGTVRRTEYDGVANTLAKAREAGFGGRFLYMTSSGIGSHSFWTMSLNLYKGGTLKWRERAERLIRESGLTYTIIRTGVLLNRPAGVHQVQLQQARLPLSPRYRIGRADVAEVFVAALEHPRAARSTFEIAWAPRPTRGWYESLESLTPDGSKSAES